MKTIYLLPVSLLTLLFLNSCSEGMPKMAWGVDEGTGPAYATTGSSDAAAAHRPPLDVPPELRAELQVPSSEDVATISDEKAMPANYRSAVAGKYVALDAKRYNATAGEVFSAVVDAMTSMNLPVQSVDSPSGTLTTDWIRKGAGKANAVSMFTNLFGLGGGPKIVRYRYVARVMRATVAGQAQSQTQLEIRTIGQVYDGHNWVNAQLKQKVADDLFSAFEEQLARTQAPKAAPAGEAVPAAPAPVAPADELVDEPIDDSQTLDNQ